MAREPRFNPSITQRVRTALIEDGHADLIIETFTDGMAELEEKLADIKRDVKLLQDAERERITKSGIWPIVEAKINEGAIDWGTWALRGSLGALGALGLAAAARYALK